MFIGRVLPPSDAPCGDEAWGTGLQPPPCAGDVRPLRRARVCEGWVAGESAARDSPAVAPARRAPRSRSHDPVDAGHQAGRRTPGPERRSKGDFLEFFKAAYGPIIAVYRYIGDDTERAAALDAALTDLAAGAHEDAAGPR